MTNVEHGAEPAAVGSANKPGPQRILADELTLALNRRNAENESDTPDYILGEFLSGVLEEFNRAVRERDKWWGFAPWEKKPEPPDAAPVSEDEAVALDRWMGDHMAGHWNSNNVNSMSCDVACRTQALRMGVQRMLDARKEKQA